jgi:hypothetical protein
MRPGTSSYISNVFDSLEAKFPAKSVGVVSGLFVSNVAMYNSSKIVEGESPIVWRQGIKHDASSVMELFAEDGLRTRTGDRIVIEDTYLYPMFKSTDVFHNRLNQLSKWMIVPQRHTGDNTDIIRHTSPKLWAYLQQNSAQLDNRKSSIYRNKSRFSIFGIGDYSFSPYKVVVSGFHKEVRFQLSGPISGKPAVFDDACYLLSFDSPVEAGLVYALLNSVEVNNLLNSIVSWDNKRPITKKVLQRINLLSVAEHTNITKLLTSAQKVVQELGIHTTLESLKIELRRLTEEWDILPSQLELHI